MGGPVELIGLAGRAQQLFYAAVVAVAIAASLACWALIERVGRVQAEGARDRAEAQLAVVSAAAKACSASVDQAKRVGEAAIAATGTLAAAAARLNAPREKEVRRIETIIEKPTPIGAGCNQAWDELERLRGMAGAP